MLSSLMMDVFVIPIGRDRYELYCEHQSDAPPGDQPARSGLLGRLQHRFQVLLHDAEERRHAPVDDEAPASWAERQQRRMMAWVAERIAEQRLLWNLRRESAATASYPVDMTFDQARTLIMRVLRRDYERHRLWLVVDTLLLIVSGVLAIVPGPNLVAYYFLFRAGGHWLSMRGARQGLHHIEWTGHASEPLSELREAATLENPAREEKVHAVAERLRLQHLATFFERVTAVPHV